MKRKSAWQCVMAASLLMLSLDSCENLVDPFPYQNAVDPASPQYQGVPSSDKVDEFTVMSPADGAVSSDPFAASLGFRLVKINGAEAYQLRISRDQSGSDVVYTSPELPENQTAVSLVDSLRGERWFQARVRKAGAWSPWTAAHRYSSDATVPVLSSLSAGNGQITVGWEGFSSADDYEIFYGTSTDLASSSLYTGTLNQTSRTAILTGLTGGASYSVWVRAKKGTGKSLPSLPLVATPFSGAPSATVSAGDKSVTVDWTPVGGASAYEVWYGSSNDLSIATRWGTDVTATSARITGLTNGSTYWVWVKAKNTNGSLLGTQASAQTVGTPSLQLSASDGKLTASWAAVAGAATYQLWYHTANDLAGAKSQPSQSSTTGTLTGLVNGTLYYVWVQAKNPTGSVVSTAVTAMSVGTPTLSLTSASGQLSASWPEAPGASSYELWYGSVNDLSLAAQAGGSLTATSTTISGLSDGTFYYVWLKAKNAYGSVVGTQVMAQTVGTPLLTLTATDGELDAAWSAIPGATGYELWYHTALDFSQAVKFSGDVSSRSAALKGLTNGTTYYVWLKALNATGSVVSSAVSAIAVGTPVLTLEAGDQVLKASWAAVPGASEYELWYNTANTLTGATQSGGVLTGSSASINGLTNGTTYYVWLKAKNAYGTVVGTQQSAQTVGTPMLNLTPADGQITASWATVAGATAYEVWYSTSNDLNSASRSGGDLTTLSHTITSLTNGVTYFVWVKAKNSNGMVVSTAVSAKCAGTAGLNIDNRIQPMSLSLSGPTDINPFMSPQYSATCSITPDSYIWYVDGVEVQRGSGSSYAGFGSLLVPLGIHRLELLAKSGSLSASVRLLLELRAAQVGEPGPAGGLIFYDKGNVSNGWRYMECAPSDQSSGIAWLNGSSFSGTTDSTIGSGRANTASIVATGDAGSNAATLCVACREGGKSDWFLPSQDELGLMFTNLRSNGKGNFADVQYWSSTKDTYPTLARSIGFYQGGGGIFNNVMATAFKVRAVRAF